MRYTFLNKYVMNADYWYVNILVISNRMHFVLTVTLCWNIHESLGMIKAQAAINTCYLKRPASSTFVKQVLHHRYIIITQRRDI